MEFGNYVEEQKKEENEFNDAGNYAQNTINKIKNDTTTKVNNEPVITVDVTRDITVNSDPTKSTSWIQISAKAEDADSEDKLDVKIYLGTAEAEKLGQADLIANNTEVNSRNNTNREKR